MWSWLRGKLGIDESFIDNANLESDIKRLEKKVDNLEKLIKAIPKEIVVRNVLSI